VVSAEAERGTGPGPSARSLAQALGIDGYERLDERRARMRMPVGDRVRQPFGIVHGGAFAALAETVCSIATYESVGPEMGAFGQSNDSSFLRPVFSGVVEAEAVAMHRGRTTWVWEVEMSDSEGRLCALSRLTIAVRPLPPEARASA
jgi:1,4-dihydroxy-2-naphthoyl-CoA hydrolase